MSRTLRTITLRDSWAGPLPLTLRPLIGGALTYEAPGESHTARLSEDEAASLRHAGVFEVEAAEPAPATDSAAGLTGGPDLEPLAPEDMDDDTLADHYTAAVGHRPGNRTRETMLTDIAAAGGEED